VEKQNSTDSEKQEGARETRGPKIRKGKKRRRLKRKTTGFYWKKNLKSNRLQGKCRGPLGNGWGGNGGSRGGERPEGAPWYQRGVARIVLKGRVKKIIW